MFKILALAIACNAAAAAADRPQQGPSFEDGRLRIVLIPRTPEQMAAFYEARGFPPEALDRIRQACFITVQVRNKSSGVLWLDLDNWQFSSAGEPLERLAEDYWQTQWDAIGLRRASRSTFSWTRLPAVRDLQPDESVGGNVALPGTAGSIDIDAVFPTGADRQGETLRLGFGRVSCGAGTEP